MSTNKTQIPEEIHCNLKLSSSARKIIGEVREKNMSNTTKAVQWIVEDYCRLKNKLTEIPKGRTLTDQDMWKIFNP